ncbi:hypothetical protein FYJ24_06985 [Actinomycetaceae bacterium WB03_NA08]|uniref:Uncharacterized protein n=1 Tax=Scrofimicrobium canadense TaxID=2652290 RepID=A0A6N7W7V5_9ACTO|nr:hypothetical protein [Scrofimicrobium canadense]MSS84512.1 hypothetical protein [Scrofimicrobium canadense]
MSVPVGTCLQCDQSRETVKSEKTYCATVTGYECVETQDEWPRHHWRDWSDKELSGAGLHPSLWDQHRRTNIYDLEWPARTSRCMEKGHIYPDLTNTENREFYRGMEHVCMCCYESKDQDNG